MLTSYEIRERFLHFFQKRGHALIPSASLVPENDPSVLFNTAGMQPLVPYLLGEKHPQGNRLANAQKCVRTVDIDEIGDNTHATFFEMLGNWSLGDYFKKDAIGWSYEFLTSKEEGLGLDARRLYVTVFGGNDDAPRDTESYELWRKIFEDAGISGERIYYMVFADDGKKEPNWWSPGDNGPCGPDSEMFYDVTGNLTHGMTKEAYMQADARQDVVEIWNDVFMEYEKKDGKVIGKLSQKNVDTGSGLERITMVVQEKNNIFDTDIFSAMMTHMNMLLKDHGIVQTPEYARAQRIIADHIRTAVFLVGDGIIPSNKDQGYILRRLIRRGVRLADKYFPFQPTLYTSLIPMVINQYDRAYPELKKNQTALQNILTAEENKFGKALQKGNKEAAQRLAQGTLTGKDAFELFTTYGFPLEMTQEIAAEQGCIVDETEFRQEFEEHRDLSRTASAGKFKGGLADHGVMSVKYHTATHLLQQALRIVLGDHIEQKGSNITAERLRFDFSHSMKMTENELKKVESIVNQKIDEALPVSYRDIPLKEAKESGAIGLFGDKYGETVRIYQVGDFSLELCGGPHVGNTSELGIFTIVKEEASSAGVRRIKAVLR